jgi:hypothetical protein
MPPALAEGSFAPSTLSTTKLQLSPIRLARLPSIDPVDSPLRHVLKPALDLGASASADGVGRASISDSTVRLTDAAGGNLEPLRAAACSTALAVGYADGCVGLSCSTALPLPLPLPALPVASAGVEEGLLCPFGADADADLLAPHLHQDWALPCHICAGTGLSPCHICTGTEMPQVGDEAVPVVSVAFLGSPLHASSTATSPAPSMADGEGRAEEEAGDEEELASFHDGWDSADDGSGVGTHAGACYAHRFDIERPRLRPHSQDMPYIA